MGSYASVQTTRGDSYGRRGVSPFSSLGSRESSSRLTTDRVARLRERIAPQKGLIVESLSFGPAVGLLVTTGVVLAGDFFPLLPPLGIGGGAVLGTGTSLTTVSVVSPA